MWEVSLWFVLIGVSEPQPELYLIRNCWVFKISVLAFCEFHKKLTISGPEHKIYTHLWICGCPDNRGNYLYKKFYKLPAFMIRVQILKRQTPGLTRGSLPTLVTYITGGLNPGLNPGFGVLRPGLSCAHHSGVNDSAEIFSTFYICTAESMTPLCKSQRSQWLCCARHSGVNDSAVHVTAESLTPLWQNSPITKSICLANTDPYWKRLYPCLRGLGGVVWWKKPEVENLVSGSL
jgi:hypothetical protein